MRCIRAVKALRAAEQSSMQVIALFTESDRDSPYVRHADEAFELPAPRGDVAAFLDVESVLELLIRARVDAVWPGWGFLAEAPDFVDALTAEGIAFLGPSSAAMRSLGDKVGAKQLAEKAMVPVAAWSGGVIENLAQAGTWADRIGFPVVIKAVAGGGGRGIRVVEQASEVAPAFRSAAAEARNAFADDRLFVEKKLVGARHIEVQIAGDAFGSVRSFGSRDCSVQRRHQKVIEEAPPPNLDSGLLRSVEISAIRIAEAVGYRGVGTAEFLLVGDEFYFMEMNPRLQVEHGITEEVAGVDLVELQIRLARGEAMPLLPSEVRSVAIEARVCAEDPRAGFAPAPGRIEVFDPATGPGIRIDSGVVAGSPMPAAFDSLVAKVIATGRTREQARARLVAALGDFDLVVAGGTTNKGALLDALEHPDFRAGGVDTGWLEREVGAGPSYAVREEPALVAAAILSYQRWRALVRSNFYDDPANLSAVRVPPSAGQEIDLVHDGETYRLRVYAVGSWRYRVYLEDRSVLATLREEGAHTARLELGGQNFRVAHDATAGSLGLEIEGRAFRFGLQTAGHVRAGAPAMVVAVSVEPGESVQRGQRLGVLEAMKMEVGFEAPVAGVVSEVRVHQGQQVAAGEVILVIEPTADVLGGASRRRIELTAEPDALGDTVRDEVRRVLLGYDADPDRAKQVVALLESPPNSSDSETLRAALAEIRHELIPLADVARLFVRSTAASASGDAGPSNYARLRMFVRRSRAGGAGIDEGFLGLVGKALQHYGVSSLEACDALERAVLRLLASQSAPELRDRLVLAVLRNVHGLAVAGLDLSHELPLRDALEAIASMRGLFSDAVSDAAIEARYLIFEHREIERRAEETTQEVTAWLRLAESSPVPPPEPVLLQLADAPRSVFDRVGRWLSDPDPRRRAIALAAHLRRLYAPAVPQHSASLQHDGRLIDRLALGDGRRVLAGTCAVDELGAGIERLLQAGARETRVAGFELFVALSAWSQVPGVEEVAALFATAAMPARFTLNWIDPVTPARHWTFVPQADTSGRLDASLHELHPEVAARVNFGRLAGFALERIPAPEDIYCFYGRGIDAPSDERLVILADLRSETADHDREASLHVGAFEHVFFESTRALRNVLARRDPKRRLQWNRIQIYVAPEVFLDEEVVDRLSRRLAPATRHLGLEKVVVRLCLLDRAAPERPARDTEIVISDLTGSHMTVERREPRSLPLETRSEYERSVIRARRRGVLYPYEILRMLRRGAGNVPSMGPSFSASRFEEYDLDPNPAVSGAVSVAERPYGENAAGVVFGMIETPTDKVPEGMRRVIVLSDPTRELGALGAAECDRICAAIDLARERGVPLEWVSVSSGARIAMDSGTENLDATARVVRRIVEFTQQGGVIHIIAAGVNIGAQSYWNALSTMLAHTRGALIMTGRASMMLTGRAALDASGSVSAEDDQAIGGYERVMGPNGEAQYFAPDLVGAFRVLFDHYRFTYVVPGEAGPRPHATEDTAERNFGAAPCTAEGFERVSEIFDATTNPGRKRAFPMRDIMGAVIDRDGGHLERWRGWTGAETAVVWDAHLGGHSISLIGIESRNLPREGYRPADGPDSWTGGTLFPLASKKVARALNAASGNRPVVVLANLSGFDGSPESMRKLQLEYGAEIARAVVNFRGPILFCVVSRYHGGAYVVFSRELNPRLRALALTGSYASVIGGGPAAAVVLSREVRARAAQDPRVLALSDPGHRGDRDAILAAVRLQKQAELASEFDAVHTVDRAREVGSLDELVDPARFRQRLAEILDQESGS